jgi:Xaa-Pro dipeptidase
MFATNRKRLCKKLQENGEVPKGALVVLQGGEQRQRNCTDTDEVFRQVTYEQIHKNRNCSPINLVIFPC